MSSNLVLVVGLADLYENCCYVDLEINLLVEPSDELSYVSGLRRVGHRHFTLSSRKGTYAPSTVSECRTCATQAGVQSPLCHITCELTILLHHASYMSSITSEGWVTPSDVARQDFPAIRSLSQSRYLSPHSTVAVGDGIRE